MALNKSAQRIYEYFKKNPSEHPSAEEVYDHFKSKKDKIGVATVYRNLKSLVELGYLKEINLEKQGVRYDLVEIEHYHFVCDVCGKISNFELDELKQINQAVERTTQGHILRKDLLFHGICASCLHQN